MLRRRKPAQRATACSPGRVREALGARALGPTMLRRRKPAQRATDIVVALMREACRITEQSLEQMLSPATRACMVVRCLPRARGLALGYTLSPAMRACMVVRCLPRASPTTWACFTYRSLTHGCADLPPATSCRQSSLAPATLMRS